MRISDWSSDVCSSDLRQCSQRALHRCAVDPKVREKRPAVRGRRGELKRERSPHRLVSRSPQSDVGGRCRLDLRDKRFSSRQSCVEVLEHVPPCVHRHRRQQQLRERGKRALQGFRSEEHTSELQSLMRISYAVFCLKKKTELQQYKQQ